MSNTVTAEILKDLYFTKENKATVPVPVSENRVQSYVPIPGFVSKRQADQFSENNYFIDHPIVALAIRIYTTQLVSYPIKVIDKNSNEKIDHPILKVLQKPNSFQSGTQFLTQAARNIIAGGQQVCVIKYDKTNGQVTELLPFLWPNECWAHRFSSKGSSVLLSEPTEIENNYFYMSGTKIYRPDQILHIKDMTSNSHDLLNSYPRLSPYNLSLKAGISLNETLAEINRGLLVQPDVWTAPEDFDADAKKEFVENTDQFFQQDISVRKRAKVIASGFQRLQQTKDGTISSLTPDLKKINDLDLARVFDISYLLHNYNSGPQAALKEIFKFMKQEVFRPWLKHIADQLTCQLLTKTDQDRGLCLKFNLGLNTLDKRELSTYVKTSYESGLITLNEGRAVLDLQPVSGGDCFKTETKKEDENDNKN